MKKDIINSVKIIILSLVLGLGIGYASAVYTPPTATPTGGNTPAPINVGTVYQIKNGALGVGGLGVFGTSKMLDDVCIGFACELGTPTDISASVTGMLYTPGSFLATNLVKGNDTAFSIFSKITGVFDFKNKIALAEQTEGPIGDPTCKDLKDNDGDTLIDGTDPNCQPNGSSPSYEGPSGDISCFDYIDNDLDGLKDALDDGCQTIIIVPPINTTPTPTPTLNNYILTVAGDALITDQLRVKGLSVGSLKGGSLCADANGNFMICTATGTTTSTSTAPTGVPGYIAAYGSDGSLVSPTNYGVESYALSMSRSKGSYSSPDIFGAPANNGNLVIGGKLDGTGLVKLSGNTEVQSSMSIGGNLNVTGLANGINKPHTTSSVCNGSNLGRMEYTFNGKNSYSGNVDLYICVGNDSPYGYHWAKNAALFAY